MAPRTHVQLIEKTNLRSSVWLTFWDVNERAQLSVQVNNPAPNYEVGEIFTLDRAAKQAELALVPSSEKIDEKLLLVPRKVARPVKKWRWAQPRVAGYIQTAKWLHQKVPYVKVRRNAVVLYGLSEEGVTKVTGVTKKKRVLSRRFSELKDKALPDARKSNRAKAAISDSVSGIIIK